MRLRHRLTYQRLQIVLKHLQDIKGGMGKVAHPQRGRLIYGVKRRRGGSQREGLMWKPLGQTCACTAVAPCDPCFSQLSVRARGTLLVFLHRRSMYWVLLNPYSVQGQASATVVVYTVSMRDKKKHQTRIVFIFQSSTALPTCLESYHFQWGLQCLDLKSTPPLFCFFNRWIVADQKKKNTSSSQSVKFNGVFVPAIYDFESKVFPGEANVFPTRL